MTTTNEHRLREARSVVEQLRLEASTVQENLGELFEKVLEGDVKAPAAKALVLALAVLLEEAAAELEAAERELTAELADDDAPRSERDTQGELLFEWAARFRDQVRVVAGEKVVRALGYEGSTPRDPQTLVGLVRTVLERAPKVKIRARSDDGVSIDVARATKGGGAIADLVSAALKSVAREGREEQKVRARRNKAVERFVRVRNGVLWTAEGLFTLAGLDEQAARVRLVVRSAEAETEVEGEEPVDGGGEEGERKGEAKGEDEKATGKKK